ncbi:MAG TPA: glycosyltransferase family 2 protein [Phycisphaerae bacterium]|nr:glycosyltransferase family 2 protein [Phycisphaerae bacterium]
MDVSVIIVSYNTRSLALACLRSVFAQTAGLAFEVIVVDNASTDGSAEAIAEEFPQVRLIRSCKNLGFAGANNVAGRVATGDWLLLLNPDTVVLDRAIAKLRAFGDRAAKEYPRVGIFGGRTLFGDGSLNPTCAWGRPTPWSMFCRAIGMASLFPRSRLFNQEAMPDWNRDTVREVDIVTGCFFLLRRSLWERLDGFDPAFFMYAEEADFCLRSAGLGIRGMIVPDATIVHYGGASERVRADKIVRLFRAKAMLMRRHWGRVAADLGVAMLSIWALTRLMAYSAKRLITSACGDSLQTWLTVWNQRAQWSLQQGSSWEKETGDGSGSPPGSRVRAI